MEKAHKCLRFVFLSVSKRRGYGNCCEYLCVIVGWFVCISVVSGVLFLQKLLFYVATL